MKCVLLSDNVNLSMVYYIANKPEQQIQDYAVSSEFASQNVKFTDINSGIGQSAVPTWDHTRKAGMNEQINLQDFFSRPIKIHKEDWNVGNELFFRINPWQLFWEDPINFERIKHFRLLQCTMKVKVVLNGNAFYFGRAIASYNPWILDDNITVSRAWVDNDVTQASQKPHFFINPTLSQGGEMELPFFWDRNALDVVAKEWQYMGELTVHSIQPLKHVNAGNRPISVSVFAWAENVHFAMPTQSVPANPVATVGSRMLMKPEADEYGTGIVSKPASTVAKIAKMGSFIPVIAPFARATEIGAKAVAGIASIFGYSAPAKLDAGRILPVARSSMATTNNEDEVIKLTVDEKQELTLDSRVAGIDFPDELPIASIASKESFLTNFSWPQIAAEETLLYSMAVDPGLHTTYAPGNGSTEYHLPACAFAVLPFKYWKGTMRFRFQVVSSEYHKGRIKIVYDPLDGQASSLYNTALTTVFDIADQKDFTYDVAWGQPDTFREHLTPTDSNFISTATPVTTANSPKSNGVLSVYVVNELTTAGAYTASNDIEVNVFVSALDDFEVANPWPTDVSRVRYQYVPPPGQFRLKPEGQEGSDDHVEDSTPTDPPPIDLVGGPVISDAPINTVFFGEVIGSFRQMLKRYQHYETVQVADSTNAQIVSITRQLYPLRGGPTLAPVDDDLVFQRADLTHYMQVSTTLMNYLMPAFAGVRGGVRWLSDFSYMSDSKKSLTVSRSEGNGRRQFDIPTFNTGALSIVDKRRVDSEMRGTDIFGCALYSTVVNPIASVEVPFYSNLRFASPRRLETDLTTSPFPAWNMRTILNPSEAGFFRLYCSAAEDFNLFFFVGAPIIYYEDSYPAS